MALLSESGFLFLLRWIHFLSGITWIGLLYYFNFVQTPFFAETEAPVRSGAQQKLSPPRHVVVRWGAMITFLSGWLYLLHWWIGKRGLADPQDLGHPARAASSASVMWANVWFVIHPKQKIVIQNALDTAAGKPANPARRPREPARASPPAPTLVFSMPMLFMMGAASHLPLPMPGSGAAFWLVALIIIVLVEWNCLAVAPGKPTTKILATVKGTLWFGFILTVDLLSALRGE
jgi:uncharacterized membrane protein